MIGQTFGHYLVLEKIGAGGMGEVYRAHDQHLERDVALKILPAGFLTDEAARKRFRGEALALSKLNHPNIATVFDFDTQGNVDFLAMELIQGTPLTDQVKAGPMPEKEILRVGMQLADGLAAAHAQGVIHRDLKPGNLMITPDGRLKILDFGLATLTQPEGDPDITRKAVETTSISGTVPYMPPEQLRGQTTDVRSDIYAAGAVLYEMATGRRPFPQSQSAELIGAILHHKPAQPSTLNRRMTSGFESVVMKSLDKEPEHRYQSSRELLVALEGIGSGITPVYKRRVSVAVGVAILAAVLSAILSIVFNVGDLRNRVLHRDTAAETPVHARRSVAVLGFKNLSGRPDDAWLSTALSEMLTTELAAGEHLRMIPGENVAQMKINLSLSDAESFGKETLLKIRANLGADTVVLGSYVSLGERQIRLDVRLQDALVGETSAAISERGSELQIDDLVSRAGATLRQKLGVGEISPAEAGAVKATLPSNPEAIRFYTEGIAKLHVFDALSARDLLEKAVAADPEYPLAHSALAATWTSLGYDEKAKAEAKRAFDVSTKLSREDRLAVEGRYRETINEREKAVEIYRTLWNFFPDNLEYGLQLVSAQIAASQGKNALNTVEALRKLPPPASTDPRIDLAEANVASALAEFKRQLAASEKAAARASADGTRLLVARAQLVEGAALRRLGQTEKAMEAMESARQIYTEAGDRGGTARALFNIGIVFWNQAEFSKADTTLKEALGIQDKIGDKRGVANSLNLLATVRTSQNDLPEAKKFFEDVLVIWRELNDRRGAAAVLNNIGAVLYLQGDPNAAKSRYEEALSIRREVGDKAGVALLLNNIGEVLSRQSDLPGARRMFEESLAVKQEINDKHGIAFTLRNLGNLLFKQGDVVAGRKRLEEALALQNEIGEKGQAAETRIALARLMIDEGQAAKAEIEAQKAADEFEREKVGINEASARDVLARSQLAQKKLPEARKAIDAATKLLKKSDDPEKRLPVFITAARIATTSEPVRAAASLEAIVAEAKKFHVVDAELDARLAMGEIEMQSAKNGAGRSRLSALEKDAIDKGMLQIARKVRVALDSR